MGIDKYFISHTFTTTKRYVLAPNLSFIEMMQKPKLTLGFFVSLQKTILVNYLSVENISKSYGERILFEDISFGINKDQKVAFVAKNGSGKTSILNIIAGLDVPDSGQVVSRKGISIAYLAQKDDINPELTIEETIFATDNKILSIVNALRKSFIKP